MCIRARLWLAESPGKAVPLGNQTLAWFIDSDDSAPLAVRPCVTTHTLWS